MSDFNNYHCSLYILSLNKNKILNQHLDIDNYNINYSLILIL